MKRQREILFLIFCFAAVFSSVAIDAHSLSIHPEGIEIQSDTNKDENTINSNTHPADHDQLNRSYDSGLKLKSICQVLIPRNNSGVEKFSFIIWQPPKFF